MNRGDRLFDKTPRAKSPDSPLPGASARELATGSSLISAPLTLLPTPDCLIEEDSGPPSSRQEEKQRKLKADYQAKQAEIREKWRRVGDEATPIQVKPRKADVRVTHFGLAWVPAGQATTAAREDRAPARPSG